MGVMSLRQIREEHYISRKRLAERAGVSESTIVRIENAQHRTTYEVATKVLATLSEMTGKQLTVENVEGLNLYNVMRDRGQRGADDEDETETVRNPDEAA